MPKKTAKKLDVITLNHLPREWQVIDKRIIEINGNKKGTARQRLSQYLSRKISSLQNDYTACDKCVIEVLSQQKEQRQNRISAPYIDYLDELHKLSGLPVSTIIDRLIINPLLIEK